MLESMYKNILCDPVNPVPGSIVKVDLWGNLIKSSCHTGIYVGNNQIVEMTNNGGTGTINKVSIKDFLGYSLHRTGVFIYVASIKSGTEYVPLADQKIAERALDAVGDKTKYNLFIDNCHLFTAYCITGSHKSFVGTLEIVENALIKEVAPNYKNSTLGDPFYEFLRDINKGPLNCRFDEKKYRRHDIDIWRSTGVAADGSFPTEKICWRCKGTGKIVKNNKEVHCDLCDTGKINLIETKLKLTEAAEKYPSGRCWRCDGYGIITKYTSTPHKCHVCMGTGIL